MRGPLKKRHAFLIAEQGNQVKNLNMVRARKAPDGAVSAERISFLRKQVIGRDTD